MMDNPDPILPLLFRGEAIMTTNVAGAFNLMIQSIIGI